MDKTPLYTTLLWVCCAAVPLAGADAAGPRPWRSLLNDDSAPDWRGWKEPGFPAGWHVAGGKSWFLPAAPVGGAVVVQERPPGSGAGRICASERHGRAADPEQRGVERRLVHGSYLLRIAFHGRLSFFRSSGGGPSKCACGTLPI